MGNLFGKNTTETQMGCSTSKDITVARIKTTDSGIFLILGADTGDSKSKWEELAKDGRERAAKGAMPGFDPQQMEVGPMMANPMWGEDMGPPFKTAGGDKKGRKSVDADLRAKAEALAAKRYKLNLSSPKLTFLLGSEQNDAATGGPVFVTAEHEANRKVIDGVREEIGLKPFPKDHCVHTTLCKITGKGGDHAALRAALKGWPVPKGGRFPQKIQDLSDAFKPDVKPPTSA
jgi:hypothetical protein